jgi:hypothetical protein
MLATTLAVTGGVTLDKISEDSVRGSVYLDPASLRVNPHGITVKHEYPANGKAGFVRDLVQVYAPIEDGESVITADKVVVNLTITRPNTGHAASIDAAVTNCMLDLIVAISNGTTADTFIDQVIAGHA